MGPRPPERRPYAPRLPLDERREQLLSAALRIAVDRGFHAVTVDAVARAYDVTRPVVYSAFASRADLLDALLEQGEQRALSRLAAVFPAVPAKGEDVDPDDLLLKGIAAYLHAVTADPDTWRIILVPPEGAPAELTERIGHQRRTMLATPRGLTEWGLTHRGDADVDPDLFARGLHARGGGREAAARGPGGVDGRAVHRVHPHRTGGAGTKMTP